MKTAFESAIARTPTDSTTRRVYADWLEDKDALYEASYQRWAAVTIDRGAWPPVAVLTTVPFLHLSDLVKIKVDKLPPPIAALFLGEWQTRRLLTPWEVEPTLRAGFVRERFIFTDKAGPPLLSTQPSSFLPSGTSETAA